MDQATTLRKIVNTDRRSATPAKKIGGATRVIAITSGKGGVGKTNIVLNLCMGLAALGRRVFLLDADMGLANVDVLLGLTPQYTLEHVLSGQKDIRDILLTGPGGFKILPSGSGVSELSEMTYDQQMRLFQEMSRLDDEIDYLFIDTGAGISSNVLRFNASANEILVVANSEPTSITDAYALMKLLSIKYHIRDFGLIANSVSSERDGRAVFETLHRVCGQFLKVNLTFIGWIPYDPAIHKAVRRQRPVLEAFPSSPASRNLTHIAGVLDANLRQSRSHPALEDPELPSEKSLNFWDRLLHWKKV